MNKSVTEPAGSAASDSLESQARPGRSAKTGLKALRSRLFYKYVALVVAVVLAAQLANGLMEVWATYKDYRAALIRLQHEQAGAAAAKIEQFIREIENQLGWTTQLPWSSGTLEQRRFDALRFLRQVPAVTELAQIDASGREQLRVSRLAMDVIGSGTDQSREAKFTEAMAHKVYYGPVYFRRESEPYMTLAISGARRDAGVSVAEVNLKFIWDVVSQIKVGERGRAYVVDGQGRLIAHPDISLVLRKTDMSHLAQVEAARADDSPGNDQRVREAVDIQGRPVLTAYAPVSPLRWLVFVELPTAEAYAPLASAIQRTVLILLATLVLATLAGTLLTRRLMGPIRDLQAGAALIGRGSLDHRISVKTGDELEALADQFNDMAGRLQDSYSELERKVELRTLELAQSVEELRALGEVSQAVNSTLDVETVLSTIAAKAVQLSGAAAGAIYVFSEEHQEFLLRATYGMDESLISAIKDRRIRFGETVISDAAMQRGAVQIPDVLSDRSSRVPDVVIRAGFRALLVVPLLGPDQIVGALVVRRKTPGEFPENTVELLETFAAQSVLAIQNARLFREIAEKSRQLEVASRHKSQFLANMSHELRTPLNAILGYTELILDGIYGEAPEKMHEVLERVQGNGRHLLGLINDVLDLSKIEAGQLTLSIAEYSLADVIQSVSSALEALAREKELVFEVHIPPDLPTGRGDERRLAQVLLNLVGNAIKFTDTGGVAIRASSANGSFDVSVRDTGPGIDPVDHDRIFEEFQQADDSSTRAKGGSGLGLSISRRIIEMHGGHIRVESEVGAGATFTLELPVTVEHQVD